MYNFKHLSCYDQIYELQSQEEELGHKDQKYLFKLNVA
jgi:hypothetical protein